MDENQIQQSLMSISGDIATLKSEAKATWKRIDEQHELVDTVHKIAMSVEKQFSVLDRHTESIAELRKDIDDIKDKPAKRVETVIVTMLTVAVSAIITFVLTRIGVK